MQTIERSNQSIKPITKQLIKQAKPATMSGFVGRFFALLRAIPSPVVTCMVVSVVCMNLLANKTIFANDWLAIDGGILLSWVCFLCMDMITKHFGSRTGNQMVIFAAIIQVFVSFIFYIASIIPSSADDYTKFNQIFGGNWFILLGSTLAFIISGLINNGLNAWIGRAFNRRPNSKLAFVTRSYVSTLIGQFFDNFIFAVVVFKVFAPIYWDGFSWTWIQCAMCAVTGSILEMLMEVIFSPIGYCVVKRWAAEGVGYQYFESYREQ